MYDNNFPSKLISEDYIVDNIIDNIDPNKLFCDQTNGKNYNKNGCFSFSDQPSSKYPLVHRQFGEYRLAEITREQEFLNLLVSVEQNHKNRIICWKIIEKFERKKENYFVHFIIGPFEVDVSEFPFVKLELPNANDRQFVVQDPNLQLGIPAELIKIPKVLPSGFNEEMFEEEILARNEE